MGVDDSCQGIRVISACFPWRKKKTAYGWFTRGPNLNVPFYLKQIITLINAKVWTF
jgi:hypothetical protein